MGNAKKIKLPDNTTVDLIDSRIPGVDTTPTANSTNVVTSGGVKSALGSYVAKAGDEMSGSLAVVSTPVSSHSVDRSRADFIVENDSTPAEGEIRGGNIIISRGYSTEANTSAGAITFYGRRLGDYRNGARIASEPSPGYTSYDRQDLVFYRSNVATDAATPVWEPSLRLSSQGQYYFYGLYPYSLYVDNTSSGATSAGIRFRTEGTVVGGIFVNSSNDLYFAAGTSSSGAKIFTASNSNLSTVDWAANNLTVAGTSTFGDTINVENRKYMYWKDSDGTYRNIFGLNNVNSLLIGYGLSSVTGSSTVIQGEIVRLQATDINEIVKTGGATLRLRGTTLNNQTHTILFQGNDSGSNGFKVETTPATTYGRQSLGFYRSNVTSGSSPYTPDWKRVLYMPYTGGVEVGTTSNSENLTVNGNVRVASTDNIVFTGSNKTLTDMIGDIETLLAAI